MLCRLRCAFCLILAALLLSSNATAFEIPLSDHSIREAYFLGQRNDQKTIAFLSEYSRTLPLPEKGPYVSEINLLTPYAQVIRVSSQHSIGYSAQQAAADYNDRGDSLLVEIRIEFTPTYSFADAQRTVRDLSGELNRPFDPEDFWRGFRFTLFQPDSPSGQPGEPRSIEPREVRSAPIYGKRGNLSGAIVSLEYDAADLDSAPTQVQVLTPSAQRVLASFDLEKLR